jgi:hypothetical protein
MLKENPIRALERETKAAELLTANTLEMIANRSTTGSTTKGEAS